MASAIIHIAVAKEINKHLHCDEKQLLLGSIAPDLSKQTGSSRIQSHFQIEEEEPPHLDLFLEKYENQLDNPFLLGYYIHLYTDYLWFKYFITEIVQKDGLILLNGKKFEGTSEEVCNLIYKDYTNLNIQIIDAYKLDLSLFYEEIALPTIPMSEIDIQKLPILIDKMGLIIKNSYIDKNYSFDLKAIQQFITLSVEIIQADIQEKQKKQQ